MSALLWATALLAIVVQGIDYMQRKGRRYTFLFAGQRSQNNYSRFPLNRVKIKLIFNNLLAA